MDQPVRALPDLLQQVVLVLAALGQRVDVSLSSGWTLGTQHSVQQSQQNVNQSKQMCTTCPRVDPFLSDIPPGRLAVLAGLAAAPAVQCCVLYTCLASPGVPGHAGHVGAAAGGSPRGGGGGGQQREVGGGGRQGDRHGQLQTLQPALTTHRRQVCNHMTIRMVIKIFRSPCGECPPPGPRLPAGSWPLSSDLSGGGTRGFCADQIISWVVSLQIRCMASHKLVANYNHFVMY